MAFGRQIVEMCHIWLGKMVKSLSYRLCRAYTRLLHAFVISLSSDYYYVTISLHRFAIEAAISYFSFLFLRQCSSYPLVLMAEKFSLFAYFHIVLRSEWKWWVGNNKRMIQFKHTSMASFMLHSVCLTMLFRCDIFNRICTLFPRMSHAWNQWQRTTIIWVLFTFSV